MFGGQCQYNFHEGNLKSENNFLTLVCEFNKSGSWGWNNLSRMQVDGSVNLQKKKKKPHTYSSNISPIWTSN